MLSTLKGVSSDLSIYTLCEKYCPKPLVVSPTFDSYSRMGLDAIRQAKLLGGYDPSRLAEAKKICAINEDEVKYFTACGGTFVVSPSLDAVRELHHFEIHTRPGDFFVPICHEGMNRSQVMGLVLNSISDRVSKPHGAESGFDPYQSYHDLNNENMYGFIHGHMYPLDHPIGSTDWLNRCFYETFGTEKQKRIGHDECESLGLTLNPSENGDVDFTKLAQHRSEQRRIMDKLLYNSDILNSYTGKNGRVIIITFCRASSIFLRRLLEVSREKNLSNIVIVCLPYPDTISRAGGSDQLKAHFAKTGESITREHINCSHLQEVFAFYSSLIQRVIPSIAEDADITDIVTSPV